MHGSYHTAKSEIRTRGHSASFVLPARFSFGGCSAGIYGRIRGGDEGGGREDQAEQQRRMDRRARRRGCTVLRAVADGTKRRCAPLAAKLESVGAVMTVMTVLAAITAPTSQCTGRLNLAQMCQAVAAKVTLNGSVSAFGALQPPATNHFSPSVKVCGLSET